MVTIAITVAIAITIATTTATGRNTSSWKVMGGWPIGYEY
jgi:hypothetical protein